MIRAATLFILLPIYGCAASSDGMVTEASTTRCGDHGSVIRGVDVSSYQGGSIDWSRARDSGYVFGIAKTTEGYTYTDGDFATNWSGMKAAGVIRGAYHFLRANDDGTRQADRMLDLIDAQGGLQADDLPPTVDVETTDGQSTATILAVLKSFIVEVQKRAHRTPILYTYLSFWQDTLGDPSLPGIPLWLANYNGQSCPQIPDAYSRWDLWQYSEKTNVPGIGTCDANEFNGSVADLRSFIAASSGSIRADNGDAAFSSSGPWAHSTSVSGFTGADYLTVPAKTQAWASWGLYGHSGQRELFARFPPSANRSSRALYRVYASAGGTATPVRVDQRSGGRISLGSYTLSDDAVVSVDASDGDGYTIADAIEIASP